MLRFPMFNINAEIVNNDKTSSNVFYNFCLAIYNRLNNNQSAKINVPTGGNVVDAEARAAINKIISSLEKYGITKE